MLDSKDPMKMTGGNHYPAGLYEVQGNCKMVVLVRETQIIHRQLKGQMEEQIEGQMDK